MNCMQLMFRGIKRERKRVPHEREKNTEGEGFLKFRLSFESAVPWFEQVGGTW